MHKVKKLEEQWFYYKAKKVLSPMLGISSLYLVFIGAYYMYETNKGSSLLALAPSSDRMTNVMGVSIEANNTKVKIDSPMIVKEEVTVEKEVMEEPKGLEKIALIPVIPVIDMEKEERISATVKKYKPVKVGNTVKAKRNDYLTAKELAVITKTQKNVDVVPRKTKKMNFTSSSSNYIEIMKDKFSKSNSPRDALLLAKTYYKNAEYVEAEKWALSANKLNNSLEDSWLLFAKSKVKLGKQQEALKVLVSYYKKSHSLKAKRLIGQIKTGKI